LEIIAPVGFIKKKFLTMHGHMSVTNAQSKKEQCLFCWLCCEQYITLGNRV